MPTHLTARERSLLLHVTSLPTAAGHEGAVQRMLDLWVGSKRGRLLVRRDDAGNALVTATQPSGDRPAGKPRRTVRSTTHAPRMLITAHLDHPAFVLRRMVSAHEVELEFRGGVHDPYFLGARLEIFDVEGRSHHARIESLDAKARPFKRVRATLRVKAPPGLLRPGCIGRWRLPPAEIRDGVLRTHACDDLAAVATAMIVFERLLRADRAEGVGLLFTVAEEVGFLGAIRAARSGIIPRGATLLCLENSRSFPHDSPIGAGAILRVGDRLSVFSPCVTNALTQLYQRRAASDPRFRWQRKLMPGGACEATAFAALGHASTCLCLPLGNYHNMRDIDGVLGGRRRGRIDREFVAVADIESLVEMLMLAAEVLGHAPSVPGPARRMPRSGPRARAASADALGDFRPLMEKLWRDRAKIVLGAK